MKLRKKYPFVSDIFQYDTSKFYLAATATVMHVAT